MAESHGSIICAMLSNYLILRILRSSLCRRCLSSLQHFFTSIFLFPVLIKIHYVMRCLRRIPQNICLHIFTDDVSTSLHSSANWRVNGGGCSEDRGLGLVCLAGTIVASGLLHTLTSTLFSVAAGGSPMISSLSRQIFRFLFTHAGSLKASFVYRA